MTKRPRFITPLGFPAAWVMAFLILLLSSPLHSNTTSKTVSSIHFAHGAFVPVSEFAHAMGMSQTPTPQNHKLTLNRANRKVILTRLSSNIIIGQEIYHTANTLMSHNGHWYMPQEAATYIAQSLNLAIAFKQTDVPVYASKNTTPAPPSPHKHIQKDLTQSAANWKLTTVVIDPGHGGKDPGAIGHNKTDEKTIVLGVAKRLKKLLEKNLNVHVILTRDDDTFIPLGTRSKMAIQQNGKIFVSLHCNATKNSKANGVEVYFLSEAKTEAAALVAQKENAALKYETEDSTQFALNHIDAEFRGLALKLLTAQFLKESQDLAANIHDAIVDHASPITPRGVKQANFYVMRGTMGQMPSVLVELGFVTHRDEAKKLRSSTHQKKLAEALYHGIKKFKQNYEQQLSANR